jgi:hypothetical protein
MNIQNEMDDIKLILKSILKELAVLSGKEKAPLLEAHDRAIIEFKKEMQDKEERTIVAEKSKEEAVLELSKKHAEVIVLANEIELKSETIRLKDEALTAKDIEIEELKKPKENKENGPIIP